MRGEIIMITADLLTRIPLFAGLPADERGSLAARAADVRIRKDEWLLMEGQSPAFFGLLEGRLAVIKAIAGRDHHVATYEPGEYFGEVPLLLGSPAVAGLRALEPSRMMRLEPADFHDLVSHCRVLNAEIMKTMERRVSHLKQVVADSQTVVATVIGTHRDARCLELREFLARNHVAFAWRDLDDPDSLERLVYDGFVPSVGAFTTPECVAIRSSKLPLMILEDGQRLESPSLRDAADAVGLQTVPKRDAYDVVIVGGGPAGLAAAVYGASEGLSTLLVERRACGGQAGTSSRIENYLGFPSGLSGDDLSSRARQQALRFSAELLVARSAASIEPATLGTAAIVDSGTGAHTIVLDDDTRVTAASVIMATGVQWRRLEAPGIDRLVGRGVYYGAAATEALSVRGCNIHIVGGGNSAGQAAIFLAQTGRRVHVLVRSDSLAASMSRYLIRRIEDNPAISLRTNTELIALEGDYHLDRVAWRTHTTGEREEHSIRHVFVMAGADPSTAWLAGCVATDAKGFIKTGPDLLPEDLADAEWPLARPPYLLETSLPGVFAIGDVRVGSTKRVSAAVGEGSIAVAFVHRVLAD